MGPVAAGLDAAHARGLVHRDVKPANVLLAEDGHVYLADFGLTRSAQEGAPEEKPHLSGTLDYVAPEQIEGEPPDPSADIYALGCVLYHCLAGEPPFAKRTQMELLWAHFNEQPPSLHQQRPELPEAIDPVIAKALAKEPAERYPSCGELAAAAAEALGVGLAPPRISRRRLLLLAAGGALAVAAATGVPAILLTRGGNGRRGQADHADHQRLAAAHRPRDQQVGRDDRHRPGRAKRYRRGGPPSARALSG